MYPLGCWGNHNCRYLRGPYYVSRYWAKVSFCSYPIPPKPLAFTVPRALQYFYFSLALVIFYHILLFIHVV